MTQQLQTPDFAEDLMGNQVRVGDRIAYAVRDGNTAELVVGNVVGFAWVKDGYRDQQVLKLQVKWDKRSGSYWTATKPSGLHAHLKRFVRIEPRDGD